MNVILEILRYILAALLAFAILIIYMCNIILSTALSEQYIVSKFEETNYFEKVHEEFNENVSKYILQSGLDDIKIDDICSKDKIKTDTIYIIENIYFDKKNEIETNSIKTNLNNKIDEYIGGKEITVESRDSIEKFEDIICKEYINTIMHTSYEEKAYDNISKIQNIVEKVNRYGKYLLIAIIIIILTVNINKTSRNISIAGMSLLLFGVILIYARYKVIQNIKVDNLFLLSNAFSDVLKIIVNENLDGLLSNAIKVITFGVILIMTGNALQIKFKRKNRKTLYLSEGSR